VSYYTLLCRLRTGVDIDILYFLCYNIDIAYVPASAVSEAQEKGWSDVTTSTAPFPYRLPYYTQLTPTRRYGEQTIFKTPQSLDPMLDFTFLIERELIERLQRIEAEVERQGWNAQFTLPARLEFVFRDGFEGLLLFDSRGHLIVHVGPAKLGYEGHGAQLSKRIMHALGVSDDVVNEIQRDTRGMAPYAIIVSREVHTSDAHEVSVAEHGLEVLPDWEWWRSR